MAVIYCRSTDGNDADSGATWALAKATLSAALTAAGAGGTVYVSDNHSESPNAAISLSSPGTFAAPVNVLCVDDAAEPPTALATTAVVATGGSAGSHNLGFAGSAYYYGLTFTPSNAINFSGSGGMQNTFEACVLELISGGDRIAWSRSDETGYFTRLINTKLKFGDVDRFTQLNNAEVEWINTDGALIGAAVPTFVFGGAAGCTGKVVCRGVDLSAAGSGKTLVNLATRQTRAILDRCEIGASVTIFGGTIPNASNYGLAIGCTSGTITLPPLGLTVSARYEGTVQSSLSRYRTGGADDGKQANPHSWEMATNASALEIYNALESPPITRWLDPDASISGATARNIITSTRCVPLATPAALTTDGTSTWNGTGVGTKQKITHTLTNGSTLTVYVASGGTLNNDDFWIEVSEPDQVGGPVSVRCFLAKPSTTVYVDPKLGVT